MFSCLLAQHHKPNIEAPVLHKYVFVTTDSFQQNPVMNGKPKSAGKKLTGLKTNTGKDFSGVLNKITKRVITGLIVKSGGNTPGEILFGRLK